MWQLLHSVEVRTIMFCASETVKSIAPKWLQLLATVTSLHCRLSLYFTSSWQFRSSPAITSLHFNTSYHSLIATNRSTNIVTLILHKLSVYFTTGVYLYQQHIIQILYYLSLYFYTICPVTSLTSQQAVVTLPLFTVSISAVTWVSKLNSKV